MTCKLVWSADARRDLRQTIQFIAARNVAAAERMERVIVEGGASA